MPIPPIWVNIFGRNNLGPALSKASAQMRRVGKSMERVGKTMTMRATLPIIGVGAAVLKTAGEFELSMNRVQALTGATGDSFESLRKQARELGATTQFTAGEAGEAMGFLGLAGFKTNEILKAMPSTLNLAAAAQMELGQSADIASNILRAFQIPAEETTRVTDVLTKTFTSTNTNLNDLAEGMKFVAPVAAKMKIPLEEVSAAMGLLGNVGLKGSIAGTALRRSLATLAAPGGVAVSVLNKLKIRRKDILDSEGNVKSLSSVIKALGKSGASVGDIMTIFGQRAGPAMAALVDQGSDRLDAMTESLNNAGGTTKKIADVQMKGFFGQLKALKSAFQELAIAIAESGLLEFMTKVARKLTEWGRAMAKTNPALLKVITVIAGIVAAIGPLLMIVGVMTSTIGAAIPVINALGSALMFLFANPIGLTILGIAALITGIVLLIKHWDWVTAKVKFFGEVLKNVFVAIWEQDIKPIIDAVSGFFDKIKTFGGGILAKFGFGGEEGGAGTGMTAGELTAGAVERTNTNNAEVKVRFENTPPGTRINRETGDVDMEMETGPLMAGAGA